MESTGRVVSWTAMVWTADVVFPQESTAIHSREMTVELPHELVWESL